MPKFELRLTATLENLEVLSPPEEWHLKIKCSNCGEESPHFMGFTAEDSVPIPGGRGEANLVEKCKLCARVISIDVDAKSVCGYKAASSSQPQIIAVFEVRGGEPLDMDLSQAPWSAQGVEGGAKFAEVDLSEKEFYDYDDKKDQSVSVQELSFEFAKA